MPGKRRPDLPDPDDVLAGRREVRLEQLFELVHAVNPSERGLAGRELAAAYATKARLQSLLIERFGEQLVVQEVPEAGDAVIGLLHRTYRKDACHAVVSHLSAKAQAWVRWQRDVRTESEGERTAPTPPRPVEDHGTAEGDDTAAGRLERAERLIEAFDFEGAREAIDAVLRESTAPPLAAQRLRTARLLLTLLVDHLADDASALGLRSELDAKVLADAEVRALLALAAARSGDHRLADDLLAGGQGEHAEAALAVLAEAALGAGRLEECEQRIARIPAGSPSFAAAQRVLAALRAARAARGRPLEHALQTAMAGADLGRIEAIAHELLALDPDSAVGRAALRHVRQAREAAASVALLAEVRRLLAAGDVAAARAAWTRLPSDAPERAALGAELDAGERAARAVRHDRLAAELVLRLDAGIDAAGVAALWDGEPEVTALVRARVATEAARWLLAFEVRRSRAEQLAAAAAATALARAAEDLAGGDELAAATHLVGHEEVARRCARGAVFCETLERAVAQRRRQQAEQRLALASGQAEADPFGARRQLDDVDRRWLDAGGKARLDELGARLAELCAEAAERRCLVQATQSGDLFAARASAARLLEIVPGPTQGPLRAELASFDRRLREQWIEDRASGDQHLDDLLPLPEVLARCRPAQGTSDGAVLAAQRGGRVFVRVICVDGRHNRTFVLRPPEPFDLLHVHVEHTVVWLTSRQSMLELDRESGQLLGRRRFAELDGVRDVECALPVPGGRKVWVGTAGGVFIVDRARWQVERRIDECVLLCPLWGHDDPTVIWSPHLVDYARTDDRGLSPWSQRGQHHVFHGAATRALGHGAATLFVQWGDQSYDPRTDGSAMLRIAALLPDGHGFGDRPLGQVRACSPTQIVTSKAAGATFVVGDFLGQGRQLVAIEASARGVGELWRVPVEGDIRLFGDAQAHEVHALVDTGTTVVLQRLSVERPSFGAAAKTALTAMPDLVPRPLRLEEDRRGCGWLGEAVAERAAVYHDLGPLLSEDERRERVEALAADDSDPVTLMALQHSGLVLPEETAILDRLGALQDPSPAVLVFLAEQRLVAGAFAEAVAPLDATPLDVLDPATQQHASHLRAVALLALGREEDARAALRLAESDPVETCELHGLSGLVEALCSPARKLDADDRRDAIRAFVRRVRDADSDLGRGAWDHARERLDHAAQWRHRDVQGMARLAAAWLQSSPPDAVAMVRKRRALAELVALVESDRGANSRRLGSANWSMARLDELSREALAWLGGPATAAVTAAVNGTTIVTQPALALTRIAGIADADDIGVMLPVSESSPVFDRHVRSLCEQAKRQWDRGNRIRLAALVIAPDVPAAVHFRTAGEQLLGIVQDGPEVAIAVPMGVVLRRLSHWPLRLGAFLAKSVIEPLYTRMPLVLLRQHGSGYGNITGTI